MIRGVKFTEEQCEVLNREKLDVVWMTQYTDLAIMGLNLHARGWKEKSINNFIENFCILYNEIARKDLGVWETIDWCKQETNIDVGKVFKKGLE